MKMSSTEFHVPGAYHFDSSPSAAAPTAGALDANLFLPPAASSPLFGSTQLAHSVNSIMSDVATTTTTTTTTKTTATTPAANTKRKRAVDDWREATPVSDAALSPEPEPQPAVDPNGRRCAHYTLAGQIETAETVAAARKTGLDESVYADIEYRRALGPDVASGTAIKTGVTASGAGADTGAATTQGERWSVLQALESVVGRVWDFCWTGAFRGFSAGGGTAYEWQNGGAPQATPQADAVGEDNADKDDRMDIVEVPRHQQQQQQQQHRYGRASLGSVSAKTAKAAGGSKEGSRRMGKRRQVGSAGDELRRNWVMVDADQPKKPQTPQTPLRPSTPTREGRPDSAMAKRRISNPVSRRATTHSVTNTSTTTTSTTPVSTPKTRVSRAGSPSLSTVSGRLPASFASPRSTASTARLSQPVHSPYFRADSPSRIPRPSSSNGGANPFVAAASSRPASPALSRKGSTIHNHSNSHSNSRNNGHSHSHSHSRSYSNVPDSIPSTPSRHRSSVAHHRHHSTTASPSTPTPRRRRTTAVVGGAPPQVPPEDSIQDSPRLDDEAKRLAAQNLQADQDADAKMEAFNRRLQAMIRQGQEALGTTFEVDTEGIHDSYWMR